MALLGAGEYGQKLFVRGALSGQIPDVGGIDVLLEHRRDDDQRVGPDLGDAIDRGEIDRKVVEGGRVDGEAEDGGAGQGWSAS